MSSKDKFVRPWDSKGYAVADLFPEGDSVFYRLPLAQRDYAWSDHNIKDLLNPMFTLTERWQREIESLREGGQKIVPVNLVESGDLPYYTVGTATFAEILGSNEINDRFQRSNPALLDVLDGQQRLTTIAMLMLACWYLLNEAIENGEGSKDAESWASELERRLSARDDSRDLVARVSRHREGETEDIGCLITQVLCRQYEKLEDHSLYGKFNHIYALVGDAVGVSPAGDLDALLLFIEVLLFGVRCGSIVAPRGKTTETFIRINVSGAPLDPMDIVKCYVLDMCRQDSNLERSAEKRFADLMKEDSKFGDKARIWIDSLYLTKHEDTDPKVTSVKALPNDFEFISESDIFESAADLLDHLEAAVAVCGGLEAGEIGAEEVRSLTWSNKLSQKYIYAAVMAAPEHARAEVADILARAVTIKSICGGKSMGSFQKGVHKICGGLNQQLDSWDLDGAEYFDEDGNLNTEDFQVSVCKILLSDHDRAEFLQSVEDLSYLKTLDKKQMLVLFDSVHDALNAGYGTDSVGILNSSLDHFHPQTPDMGDTNSDHWSEEDARHHLHRIGNMTPIPQKLNGKLGNSSISERFSLIGENKGDGIAIAALCCSDGVSDPEAFSRGVSKFFAGDSGRAKEFTDLLGEIRFDSHEWTPEMVGLRSEALAKLALISLDPSGLLLSDVKSTKSEDDVIWFYLENPKNGLKAVMTAALEDDTFTNFTLKKGSTVRRHEVDSAPSNARGTRQKMILDGTVECKGETWTLKEDISCSSASHAAGVVQGASVNGNDAWRDEDGNSINQLLDEL